jgi:hypothetical protein
MDFGSDNYWLGYLLYQLQFYSWLQLYQASLLPSSTYSAFHSRSPIRAVTGPVEIHAFSLFLTNQINRNLVHLKRP